jgi:tartrate dehydrogenase/decarboxylase/D-malate dehydrogenase
MMPEASGNPGPELAIAVIPADGIGREVLAVGQAVLDAVARHSGAFRIRWTEFPWGCDYYLETGRMMAADGLDQLRGFDAIYFGAVGWPTVPDHISLWGLRLAICQGLDLWANVRPVTFLPGVDGPLRNPGLAGTSWVVIRENSEGEYAGMGGRNLSARGHGGEVALETALFTEVGCERIIRYAFDLARSRQARHVTCVTKSNAQRFGMVLWDEVFERVASDYPDVSTDRCLVDAMAARMVLEPGGLSVVVASNLHADILSDLGSALSGSLGLGCSANLNPERRAPSMFEPVHGSAPGIAGKGIANPIGAVASGAMMIEHLGYRHEAQRIHDAIRSTVADGTLTADLGGSSTSAEFRDQLINRIRQGPRPSQPRPD